jgi:TFIIF-interacting CTD phosphatase-like protein
MISSSKNIDDINNNKIYKFPQCLSLDLEKINNNQKIRIISLFFFDAYKLLNNYNILDLKIFYDLFLNKKINKNENKKIDSVQRFNNYNKNKYRNEYYNILSHNFKNNNNSKYFLFPIKSYYEYTLMINLDTLVYYNELTDIYNINTDKNKKVILRPGVFKFLQEMKQIYELILFSNNSFDYISNILKHFSNNEKFFEYILTNNQIIFEEDDSIKNIDLLGRDLKHIIILDKVQSQLKLNKENIIYVKPFYGDAANDQNILKNLNELLKKIRYEIEDNDNIKLSIKKHKLDIFTKISTQLL